MLFLLHGSDVKRSRGKLDEIVKNSREKAGPNLGFHQFDGEEGDIAAIKNAIEWHSLFSPKKLVIIKYLSLRASDREKLYPVFEAVKNDSNTVVVLWERELDAKKLKELGAIASKVQEFRTNNQLLVTSKSGAANPIFKLGDTFFTSRPLALRTLLDLFHGGHDGFQVFSYLANHARTILLVREALDRKALPAIPGIHPFVLKKATALARTLDGARMRKQFLGFFHADRNIKTGQSKPEEALVNLMLEE